MTRSIWIFLLLCASTAEASVMLRCDPSSPTVANRVVEYDPSANTQDAWLSDPNRILNPASLPPGGSSDWKCDGGQVVALSQTEKDALVAAADVAADAAEVARIDAGELTAKELLDAINDLAGDATVNSNQLKGELTSSKLKARVKALKGL